MNDALSYQGFDTDNAGYGKDKYSTYTLVTFFIIFHRYYATLTLKKA